LKEHVEVGYVFSRHMYVNSAALDLKLQPTVMLRAGLRY
jgi:hypothetical protein